MIWDAYHRAVDVADGSDLGLQYLGMNITWGFKRRNAYLEHKE